MSIFQFPNDNNNNDYQTQHYFNITYLTMYLCISLCIFIYMYDYLSSICLIICHT